MIARRAMLAAVLPAALVLSGCSDPGVRERVTRYVDQANALQQRFAPALGRLNAAYRRQAAGSPPGAAEVRALQRGARLVARERAALRSLRPPAAARRLHGLLIDVVTLDVRLAREAAATASYAARAPGALAPLSVSGRRLRSMLGSGVPAGAQAAALEGYRRALRAGAGVLRRLRAPLVARALHRAQVRRLERAAALAGRVRSAVLARDAPRVGRLVGRLNATTSRLGIRRRALARRGLAAYGRLTLRLARAQGRLRREQLRLARGLA